MNALFIHDDAMADLEAIAKREADAAGKIMVLLEELEGDHDLLDRLTQHDFGAHRTSEFHVSKWQAQWHQGRDLWRLKLWDLEDKGLQFRIIYAFMPQKQHYHVLAIAPREFNYDSQHPLTQRILRAYKELGGGG